MDHEIKKSYDRIQMPEDARERIYKNITESSEKNLKEDAVQPWFGKVFTSGWKIGLAACLGLTLIIPAGVYAAEKISEYFTVNITKEKYQAKIDLQKSDAVSQESAKSEVQACQKPGKYIRVDADFGKEYKLCDDHASYVFGKDGKLEDIVDEPVEEGTDGMYSYAHRDGFEAGKDFYYNVLFMDGDTDRILTLYDQASIKEMTVNNHRALFCRSNTVQGSRYSSDHNTDYILDLYIFYEEYGYIINFCCMQNLGQEKLISLAEKTVVTEASENNASRYEYLSRYAKANIEKVEQTKEMREVKSVKKAHEKVVDDVLVCQVTDVKIASALTKSELKKTDMENISGKLLGKNGKLKPYIRERIKKGDGVSTPESSVAATQKVQPKVVHVTMKVRAKEAETFCLPEIAFYDKIGDKYYDTRRYHRYNRPEYITDALLDHMPCYFRETAGGKQRWLQEMKKGEERVYHFAYIVDEDLTDSMQLCFGDTWQTAQYIDISDYIGSGVHKD